MKKLLSILSFLISVSGFGQTLPNYWVPTSGTDTYTTNITNFGSSYTNKIAFVKFGNTNTGAATLQINGIASPPALRMWDGDSWEALTASQIDVNTVYKVAYSGSFWELESFGTSVDISSKQDLRPDQVYVTGTTYTVTNADAGKIIKITGASPTVVTLPTGITANSIFTFVRDTGAGLVTFVDDGTSSLLAPNGETLESELAWATWIKDETLDNFYGVGALGPAAGGAVDDVFGRTGSVVAVAGDYTATQITNTPGGTIAATDAQTAINELDTEKVPTSRTISTTSPLSGGGDLSANRTLSIADGAADGTTKGAAGFNATYFDATSGIVNIDLTNGAASGSQGGYLTTGAQTIAGVKTFSSTISGSVDGNAATVTTNANLTGHVTSTGNAAVLGSFSSSNLSTALTDEVGSGLSVFSEQEVNIQTGTTYTAVIGDRYKVIRFTNTGAITFTIPPVSSVAFPSGTRIVLIPDSTGTITVAPGSGVDIESSRGALTSLCQDCPMVLEKKTASDAWMLWNGSAISVGALSRVNSTNTNITLGGDPTNALLAAVSMTLSHTGSNGDVFVWTGTDTDAKRNVLNTSPTAYWHIKAGTASANTSPLKFTSGTLLTTIEAGSVEFNGSHYRTNTALNRIGIGGVIADFTADVANSGTSETDIQTYTTKASTLAATGEKLTARYSGTFTDATATAQMKVLFGGNTIFDSGALTLTSTGSWDIEVMIIRTGASTARSTVTMTTGAATVTSYVTETDITGLTFTNTNILKTTATAGGGGGGSSDIVGKLGSISWSPAAAN